jgi:fructoselysine-6-P-deglycase FrlB-like protein
VTVWTAAVERAEEERAEEERAEEERAEEERAAALAEQKATEAAVRAVTTGAGGGGRGGRWCAPARERGCGSRGLASPLECDSR